jgi:TolA-binding protein
MAGNMARMCRCPNHLRTLFILALLLCAGGAEAAESGDAAFRTAAEHYAAARWRDAADGFLAFADASSDRQQAATARFYAGEALVQLGRFDEAQRRLTDFLDAEPEHKLAKTTLFRLGECLLLAGENEQATTRLEQFRASHASDELNAYVLVYLGDLKLTAGAADKSLVRYEQAIREFPNGPLAMQARFGIGRALEAQQKLDEAIAAYQAIVDATGHALADDARLQIGAIQHRRREFKAAEQVLSPFETTLSASDLRPLALHWLGLARLADGRAEQAANTLRAAISAVGDERATAAMHVALADALRAAGDLAAADEQYRLVFDRWSESEWADDALHGGLMVAQSQGDEQRAESLAGELVRRFEKSPHRPAALLMQARLLLGREQYAAAEPALAELVSADDELAGQARYFLGLSLLGQQKYEAALATVAAVDTGDPQLAAAVGEIRVAALFALSRYDEVAPLLAAQLEAALVDANQAPERVTAVRTQLLVALANLGKLEEAAGHLDQLPADAIASEGVAQAALQVAERAYRADNFDLAKKWFGALTQEAVSAAIRSQALSGLAWTQLRTDGREASTTTFERVLRDYPDSPLAAEAALVRGRALDEAGQHDAALTAYRLVIDRYTQSPQLPAALLAAGRLHDKLDQDREAAELLQRLTKDYSEFAELDAALYALAWVHLDLDQPAEADAAFRRLSDDFPQSQYWADATYRLAQSAAQANDHELAAALADRLANAECDPKFQQHALYLRGQTAATQGEWDEVARAMQSLISRHPTSTLRPSAEYWLAEADFRASRFLEAREKFERLAKEQPAGQETWSASVPLRIAQCLAQEKRWAEALAAAETLAEQQQPPLNEQYEVDYLIGRCLSSQGRLDDARAAYERVSKSTAAAGSETAATARWLIGETYFHQKRYREALLAYERCATAKDFPRWQAAGLLQAGKCRLLLNEKAQAIADFQRLSSELADTPYAAEARQRLAALGASVSTTTQSPTPTRTK